MSNKYLLREYRVDGHGLISFIPESKDQTKTASSSTSNLQLPKNSGEEIKTYYEALINEPQSSSRKSDLHIPQINTNNKKRKADSKGSKSTRKSPPSERCHSEMLKFAQNGDLQNLRKAIESGFDLDFQDKYGWTALMCSAVEGHVSIVELLLNQGADRTIVNNTSQTARDLAIKMKRLNVVEILDNWDLEGSKKMKTKVIKLEKFFCDICKNEFSDRVKHESSTAHIFNRQLKPIDPYFTIPESNKGFQLMLKHGWNKSTGLGSKGQGSKYPVKTVLKRDRQGLGHESKPKLKVTHFEANDPRSVEKCKNSERRVSVRTLSKREAKYREKKDKNWEREMRHYFNTD